MGRARRGAGRRKGAWRALRLGGEGARMACAPCGRLRPPGRGGRGIPPAALACRRRLADAGWKGKPAGMRGSCGRGGRARCRPIARLQAVAARGGGPRRRRGWRKEGAAAGSPGEALLRQVHLHAAMGRPDSRAAACREPGSSESPTIFKLGEGLFRPRQRHLAHMGHVRAAAGADIPHPAGAGAGTAWSLEDKKSNKLVT